MPVPTSLIDSKTSLTLNILNINKFDPKHTEYFWRKSRQEYLDGSVLDCSISSALAMEILQFCTMPSIYISCSQQHSCRWMAGARASAAIPLTLFAQNNPGPHGKSLCMPLACGYRAITGITFVMLKNFEKTWIYIHTSCHSSPLKHCILLKFTPK